MRALYPLSNYLASFDVLHWLVLVQAQGATKVVFDTTSPKTEKWSLGETMERFISILAPAAALAGLPYEDGWKGDLFHHPHIKRLVEWCRAGNGFRRLRSVLPSGDERYTVTLRRTGRAPHRNSREDDWRTFAAEIGARVIEDWSVAPMGLHERMALYAGAEMNFFVSNGPSMLCLLSEYPAMVFDCDVMAPAFAAYGVEPGTEPPYALSGVHRHVWAPGTLEVIRAEFARWQGGR